MRLAAAALLAAGAFATHAGEFYVDPVNGADEGDGSSAHPWKTLQDVVDLRVETQDWQSLPYEGKSLVPKNAGAPVTAGSTVWLRTGSYGPLTVQGAYNTGPVMLAAEVGAEVRFTRVRVVSARNWVLRGFSVSPSHGATPSTETMVTVEDHDWSGPVSDVVIDGFDVFTVPDERVWSTRADWDTQAASGITADGDRITVQGCRVRNVGYGIAVTGVASHVAHNLVDGFCGDGLRGLGDDEVFEYNLVRNARDVNDDHRDGFQSWSYGSGGVGTGVVRNVTLRGNVIIGYDDPSVPFAGTLQGIGCFDGTYEGWLVENNVVITDHWHGISFYGARDVRIVNNTVLDLVPGEPGPPWIMITDHKDGTPSTGSLVRNNLAPTINADGTGVASDHNLELPDDVSAWFVDAAHHDLRLPATSPAVDQGTATGAPAWDADGVARPAGVTVDVGAFEHALDAVRPAGGNAGPGGTLSDSSPGARSSARSSGCGQPGQDGVAWLVAAWLLCRGAVRTIPGGSRPRRSLPATTRWRLLPAVLLLQVGCVAANSGPADSCAGVQCGAHASCTGGACACAHCWTGDACDQCAAGCVQSGADCVVGGDGDPFSFVVFGDLNGGGCERNDRVMRTVALMAAEPDVAFYVQTGDLVDGYVSGGATSCFARDPTALPALGVTSCGAGIPDGDVAEMLGPLKNRAPAAGLTSSFFPVIGNHDDNWGSGWYPDPCGGGICQFLSPRTPADFLNHPTGDVCSLDESRSSHGRDFYYSFVYRNSYFLVLRLNDDSWNMISSCNSHPGYASCGAYCSDPALAGDPARNDSCWGGVAQYDWLRAELAHARGRYAHIFVFGHAPLLGSGDSHGPTSDAQVFRDLLESHGVEIYFNGHNHAYERTHRVRGGGLDATGTAYLTVGPAGAPADGVTGDWFTAASYDKWTGSGSGFDDEMSSYVKVTVDGAAVRGEVRSLGVPSGPVDAF